MAQGVKGTSTPCSVEGCGGLAHGHGFCDRHYRRWRKYGDPTVSVRGDVVFRQGRAPNGVPLTWLRQAVLTDTNECLLWPFGRIGTGYGIVAFDGKQRKTHHVALILVGRSVPQAPLETRHLCGNRLCINTRHLLEGTRAQNIADSARHGTLPRGERKAGAKLSDVDALAIRRSTERGIVLAARYKISPQVITAIRHGRTWKHVGN